MFVALAVLLNKFKTFFEKHGRAKYTEMLASRTEVVKNLPPHSITNTSTTKDPDTGGGSDRKVFDKTGQNKRKHNEDDAKLAAACDGMFVDVQYPFLRFLRLTDDDDISEEPTKSPYYFKGRSSSNTGMTSKDVFLKVWNADDVEISEVEVEWKLHKHAFEAGVPVAAPVLPEIARSMSSCGSEYLVFAVEYIKQDNIEDEADFCKFCCSLIETVIKLHNQAKLIHGDIKPDNLRWSNGVVRLIDFEHAQSISKAEWAPGTKGYQAPEIMNKMPCSTKTDAYSVGRTILKVWEKLRDDQQNQHPCHILQEIALNLTASDPESRWSLSQALNQIKYKGLNTESPPMKCNKGASSSTTSTPEQEKLPHPKKLKR